jgi:hypothetical protein
MKGCTEPKHEGDMMEALTGTRPFGPAETSTIHHFADHYPRQWQMTLAWMQRRLSDLAASRDRERRRDATWLDEKRRTLRRITGSNLFESEVKDLRLHKQEPRRITYSLELDNGLDFAGLLSLPDREKAEGLVVLSSPEPCPDSVREYLEHGLCVIEPLLARKTRSFREDPARKWYAFDDHELIHLFAYICGGSLTGLEAIELYSCANRLAEEMGLDPTSFPIVLDARGRHVLSGLVATALHPDWIVAIRLDGASAALDHQEHDARANTLWGFHLDFDALTLLQLAEGVNLVFAEPGTTASPLAARAALWFEQESHSRRVLRCEPEQAVPTLLEAVQSYPGTSSALFGGTVNGAWDDAPSLEHLRLQSVRSKVSFLEREHELARARREERYDLCSVSTNGYKKKVAEAVASVMGEPLPRAADLNVRTRRVATPEGVPYARYEVLMQSVEGVDVAGYLLVPEGEEPSPAVICQHGLLGRPEDLIECDGGWIYHRIAATLAEKGYVSFVPFMNWGWGGLPARDALAKHAYALGMTPNQFEVAQLATIVDFLQERPEVLSERIGFYGLSYGGHASVWLGACEPRLAAVVTSGHFNDWHKKLVSTEVSPIMGRPPSYITVEEGMDMFTFNVLNLLGHAELTTLNAPRPYMVEDGFQDGVTLTKWVEDEFERVSRIYEVLGANDRAQLSHFDGPHRIWAEESLIFLHHHLKAQVRSRQR